MQLSFDLAGDTPPAEARRRLLTRFGSKRDEKRHDPVSQLILSILGAQTYDAVSATAYLRLQRRYPHWDLLIHASEADIRAEIADVTYAEKKAPCLQTALRTLQTQRGALTLDFLAGLSSDFALAWLERLPGVDRKIAAAVVNFSTLRGYAFVIDTHVLRVAQRLGWIPPWIKTAEKAYRPLMALIPSTWDADDLFEMHWLIKELGRSVCRYDKPACRDCPLRSLCAYALNAACEPAKPPPEPIANDATITLKASIARLERGDLRADWGAMSFGDASLDACMPYGGLQLGHWHEVGGDGIERETPAAAAGFTALLAQHAQRDGAIIWILQRDDLHAPGLQAHGIDPDRLILVRVDKDSDALAVQEDALRTPGVTAAVGEVDKIDLIAGRRLQLVCGRSGATGFVLRRKLYGTSLQQAPMQAAAATRWRIGAAPSVTREPGLGPPRWTARLDRCRGGRTGAWIMEMQNASFPQTSPVRVVAELADHAPAKAHEFAEPSGPRHRSRRGQRAAPGGG
jgi:protein ImuA